ncbi:hypothetical protein M1403_03405 [Patescibacteria group bacterium]|nr:hypothetical protein [Patescibacteria group bacterium]
MNKTRLAYLTKLRLLPQTIRRKVNGKITGCYPENVLDTLERIAQLKNQGLTYSQVRYELNNKENRTQNIEHMNTPVRFQFSPALAYLIIGLLLGYILATVNSINSRVTTTVADIPESSQLTVKAPTQNDPIYLLAIPDKNLYKLGKVDLKL